jgi:lysozyme family protein
MSQQQFELADKKLIQQIIVDQEGGWKLTSNKDDPDGGWTYAGVTFRTYEEYLDRVHSHNHPYWEDGIEGMIAEHQYNLFDEIKEVYWMGYVAPIKELLDAEYRLMGPVVSCAVNLGMDDAIKCLQSSYNNSFLVDTPQAQLIVDGIAGPVTKNAILYKMIEYRGLNDANVFAVWKSKFLHAWTQTYAKLVAENAEAWRQYANYQLLRNNTTDDDRQDAEIVPAERPKTLRAVNLSGWLNRIEYWR